MKFSIITPSFRSSAWLKLCIASVADQQGAEFEHLVQDSCSDDGTQDWLPHDPRVKAFIEKDAGGSAYQIAEVYALRNDAKATFEWLDRAWNNRDPGIQYLLFDPFILRYKDDPRFAAFCRKVGLPVPGEATTHKLT